VKNRKVIPHVAIHRKLKMSFYTYYFLIVLIFEKRKDGMVTMKSKGIGPTYFTGLTWAKQNAQNRLQINDLGTNFRYTGEADIPEILFVTASPASPSHLYRVENHISAFRKIGVMSAWIDLIDISQFIDLIPNLNALYLYRIGISGKEDWLKIASSCGVKIIFDTDDLTFERDSYIPKYVDGLNHVSENTRKHLVGSFLDSQERLILRADLCIGSTQRICQGYEKLGVESFFLENLLPKDMNDFHIRESGRDKKNIIGYASGSNTHHKDFSVVLPALLEILGVNPNWQFECIGFLPFSLTEIPRRIRKQIVVSPMIPQEKLLRAMSRWAIALAPVELQNPFTESKSALKYLHASIVEVVTVASPTNPFCQAIEDGVTGFLAKDTREWTETLQKLINSDLLRSRIGQEAYKKVHNNYIVDSNLHMYLKIHKKVINTKRAIGIGYKISQPSIILLLPDATLFSGGTRMAIELAQSFALELHTQIAFLNVPSKDDLIKFISHYNLGGLQISLTSEISRESHYIATSWKTAEFLLKSRLSTQKIFYFVQDFEPFFYPMNELALRAISTYENLSDRLIVLGPWNKKMLEVFFNTKPLLELDLSINPQLYVRTDLPIEYDCILFTRENSPRRLSELVKEIISRLRALNPEIRIAVYGSSNSFLKGMKAINVLGELEIQDLPTLYSRASLGVVFSPTNTSRIPFEMVATGLPVIDIKGLYHDSRYPLRFPVVFCEPNSIDISSVILSLLADKPRLANMRRESADFRERLFTEQDFTQEVRRFVASYNFLD
jgi:glycosyltransferase involved in cell wall biosynthesis